MTQRRGPGAGRQWSNAIAAATLAAFLLPGTTRAEDPLAIIRSFCAMDGGAARLSPSSWGKMASLLDWPLEPAWDHVIVIYGYEIKVPHADGDKITAEITYYVAADVRAGAVLQKRRTETKTLDLVSDGNDVWRIYGPPPVPHVFDYVVDMNALARLMEPESTAYQSASALVWNHLRNQGWEIPYESTAAIPASAHFEEVATAKPGDLAVYFSGATPYHVGVVETEGSVRSATLNAGPISAPFAAFSGTVRYWRPKHPAAGQPRAADPTKAARRATPKLRRN